MASDEKKMRKLDKNETKVYLRSYPRRRIFNLIIALLLTVIFAGWIWMNLQRKTVPWYVIGLPIVFIGMLANLLQPEEEWQYTAWQNATQKYEKNIYD